MHSTKIILAVAGLLAGGALADKSRMVETSLLSKRQSEAFVPNSETRQGNTCVAAFGPGYIDCGPSSNDVCYNPAVGQTCCESSYYCPTGSYCLTQKTCCPNDLDFSSCARQNGINLPEDFKVPLATPSNATSVTSTTTRLPTTTASNNATATVAPQPTPYTGGAQSSYGLASGFIITTISIISIIGNFI